MREGIYQARVISFNPSNGVVTCVVPSLFGDQPQTCAPAIARVADIARIASVALNDIVWVFSAGSDDSPLQWIPNVRDQAFDQYYKANRNLVDNGEFIVCQREHMINTTFIGLGNGTSTMGTGRGADRWNVVNASGLGTIGVYPSYAINSVGDPAGMAMYIQNAAVSGAIGSTNYMYIRQGISGERMLDVGFGRATALPLTCSFWAYSNTPGTFVVEIEHFWVARRCCQPYTIAASEVNGWVYKTVTFPPDTSVALPSNASGNYQGVATALNFWVAGGSSFNTGNLADLYTTWTASNSSGRSAGQTNLFGSANANFGITRIQLETGSTPTPYEKVSWSDELQRCLHWYYRISAFGGDGFGLMAFGSSLSGTSCVFSVPFPVPMAKSPAMSSSGAMRVTDEVTTMGVSVVNGQIHASRHFGEFSVAYPSFNTSHVALWLQANNDTGAYIAFDAES